MSTNPDFQHFCYFRKFRLSAFLAFAIKGQLISKGLFGIISSSTKQKFDSNTMMPQVKLFSFLFWKYWRHTKRHFETNCSYQFWHSTFCHVWHSFIILPFLAFIHHFAMSGIFQYFSPFLVFITNLSHFWHSYCFGHFWHSLLFGPFLVLLRNQANLDFVMFIGN